MTGVGDIQPPLRTREQTEDIAPGTPIPQGRPLRPTTYDLPQDEARLVRLHEDVIDIIRDDRDTQLIESLSVALQSDPNVVAEAQRIGLEINASPLLIENNLPAYRKVAQKAALDRWRLERQYSPVLRAQMRNPAFARVAHDDFASLGLIERAGVALGIGMFTHELGMLETKRYQKGLTPQEEARAETLKKYTNLVPSGFVGSFFQVIGTMIPSVRTALGSGLIAAGATTAAGPAAPLAAVPAFGIGTTLGLLVDVSQVEGGLLYSDLIDMGVDPDRAAMIASVAGPIAGLFEVTGAGFMLRGAGVISGPLRRAFVRKLGYETAEALTRPTVGRAAVEVAKGYLTAWAGEVATEQAQEITAITGEAVGRLLEGMPQQWATEEGRDEIARRLGSVFVQTGQAMTLLAFLPGASRAIYERARIQRAEEHARRFNGLLELQKQSKLANRSPEALGVFTDAAVEGTGAENVYIGAARFAEALQQTGMTREELARTLPDVAAQLDNALATGGDIVMPTGQYTAKIGGGKTAPPLGQVLNQHVRLEADGWSEAEIPQMRKLQNDMVETSSRVLDAWQRFRESADQVEKGALDQIRRAAPQIVQDEAEHAAKLFRHAVSVLAEKTLMLPHQVAAMYPYQIVGEGQVITGEQALQQLTKTPAFQRWFGDSKVVDEGGKPLVVYHGTSDAFTEFNLQHPNRKDTGWLGEGVYLWDTPRLAGDYAILKSGASAPNVMPLFARLENPYMATLADKERLQLISRRGKEEGLAAAVAWTEKLKAQGHDGVILQYEHREGGQRPREVVVFDTAAVKSATGNIGTFDPTDPNILRQLAPASFFSALAVEIEALPTKATTASGWKQALTGLVKNGKVKEDEILWTGLWDWLDLQEGKVAKEAVLDYLRANGVRVEVRYRIERDLEAIGALSRERIRLNQEIDQRISERNKAFSEEGEAWQRFRESADQVEKGALFREVVAELNKQDITARERIAEIDEQLATLQETDHPMFAQWVLPGGENYREVLLTLPEGKTADVIAKEMGFGGFDARLTEEQKAAVFERLDAQRLKPSESFRGPHFEQPNIVAHIRMNDRVDADGKRVLFIEEIQSDWAKKGRHEGFAGPAIEEPTGRWRVVSVTAQGPVTSTFDTEEQARTYAERLERMGQEYPALHPAYGLRQLREGGGEVPVAVRVEPDTRVIREGGPYPRAPFVESAKGWVNLALKQILLEAVNGGYDAVAFITGEQSVTRYEQAIRAEVKNITVYTYPEQGLRSILINTTEDRSVIMYVDGDGVVTRTDAEAFAEADGKHVSEVFGKELGERLLKAEDSATFEGEGLKIGGGYLLRLYDEMIPQALAKLSKKLGGGKVETVTLEPKEAQRADFLEMTDAELEAVPLLREGQPALTITDELRASVEKGLPLFQQARGEFVPNRLLTILREGADFSTVVHEMSHYVMEVWMRVLGTEGAPQALRDDFDTFLEWTGVESFEAWQAMTPEARVPHLEAFAYSFEKWLFEGKAPSPRMASLFEKIRRFMVRVYTDIVEAINPLYRQKYGRDLPVLTDEMRAVFGRMVAAEQAVANAEAIRGMLPLFETRPDGMSDAEWQDYRRQLGDATDAAVAEVQTRSLRDMQYLQRAQGRELRRLQRQHRETRVAVRGEVAAEIGRQPVYRAIDFIRNGRMVTEQGTEVEYEGPHKLQTEAVRELVPEGTDLRTIPITSQDGLAPDLVAEWFGFDSGQGLIDAILTTPALDTVVDARTDERMTAEHAELQDAEIINRTIAEALHNPARARSVATELRALTGATQPVRLWVAAARQKAQQILADMPVEQIKPWRFEAAERRHNVQALAAASKGQTAEAIASKRDELLQHELAREAAKIEKEIGKAESGFERFFRSDEKIAKGKRDLDFVYGARLLLREVDVAPPAEGQEATQQDAAMARLAAEFAPLHDRIQTLRTAFQRRDYRKLRLEDFREVVDTANDLWTMARNIRLLDIEGKKLEREAVVAELIGQIPKHPERFAPGSKAKGDQTPSLFARGMLGAWQFLASAKRFQHYARFMDMDKPDGPWGRWLVRPMWAQLDKARKRRYKILKRISDGLRPIIRHYGGRWDAKIEARADELPSRDNPRRGYVFRGIRELAGVLLDMGNESNLTKRLVGEGWASDPKVTDGVLDRRGWDRFITRMYENGTITQELMEWVVSVWSEFETLKADAQRVHRDVLGYAFAELELLDVTMPNGTIQRGGYAPLRVDWDRVQEGMDPRQERTVESIEGMELDYQYSRHAIGTSRGFTMERNPNYFRPLTMDLGRRLSGIDKELWFIYLQPHVKNVLKITKDQTFANAMNGYDREAIRRIILPWLENTALQRITTPGKHWLLDAFARAGQYGTGVAYLGLNAVVAIVQLTGFRMSRTEVRRKYHYAGFRKFLAHPIAAWQEAARMSWRMNERLNTHVEKIREGLARESYSKLPREWVKFREAGARFAWLPIRIAQGIVDVITWHGAYQQSIADSRVDAKLEDAHERAVAEADQTVERTQGGTSPENRARFEADTPMMRLFFQFMTFSNVLMNQTLIRVGMSKNMSERLGNLLWIPVMISLWETIMRLPFEGMPEDEDDDGYLDDLTDVLVKNAARNIGGMVPMFGPAIVAFASGEADRVGTAPAATALRQAYDGLRAMMEGDSLLKIDRVGTFLTLVTGLPIRPITRSLDYYMDVESGLVAPTSEYDYWRGIFTGRASPESKMTR